MSGAGEYVAVVLLLCLSGLFSGLNLGLMSLDKVGLELTVRTGTPSEARWARAILPIRKTGNFLLCTLLLGNTAVNAVLAIFLGEMTGGLVGGIVSTLGIVIMGEIIPQSICARYGLAVGYYTRFIVVLFMVVMAPLAYPTAKLLDCVLGEELAEVFSASQLRHLVHLNSESGGHGGTLSNFEAKLLMGALRLEERCVKEVMTALEDAPSVSLSTPLDARLVHQIFHSPHFCVPVLEEVVPPNWGEGGQRTARRVLDFLNVKDAIFYGSMPSAGLTVGDIISWYDPTCILYLQAGALMHEAYQKFEPTHRQYAVVVDDIGLEVGVVSQEDLMRGWALRNQRREDDAARFGVRRQQLNNTVRTFALTWKHRAKMKAKQSQIEGKGKSGAVAITDISPECRAHLAALLPFGQSSDVLVQRRMLFAIYRCLVRRTDAFSPQVLAADRAAGLLSLPRAYFIEEAGAVLVHPGEVSECTIVFEGTMAVHREPGGQSSCPEDADDSALPIRIFNDMALLSEHASSDVKVVATSRCRVLRISRVDFQECRGAMESTVRIFSPREADATGFVLPNCVDQGVG